MALCQAMYSSSRAWSPEAVALLGCGIAAGLAWGRIARLYAMAALAGDMHARR